MGTFFETQCIYTVSVHLCLSIMAAGVALRVGPPRTNSQPCTTAYIIYYSVTSKAN